jgi:hypothetical protein
MRTLKWLIPNNFIRYSVLGLTLSGASVFAYYSGAALGRQLYVLMQ